MVARAGAGAGRRARAGSAGGNRGCLRSTLGSCRLRLGSAPRWHRLPQSGSSAKWLVGSCEGPRPGILHGSRGVRRGLAAAARRRPATITRRAAWERASVVNKRQRCAGGGRNITGLDRATGVRHRS